MSKRLVIFTLVLGLFTSLPTCSKSQSNVRYKVCSTFDSSNKVLYNHARIQFCPDSTTSDSLVFWRIRAENGEIYLLDSILVNKKKLQLKITGEDIFVSENSDFDSKSKDKIDSLMTFILPVKKLLKRKENEIEFYYKINIKEAIDRGNYPTAKKGYAFIDYFPRLVRRDNKTGLIKKRNTYFESFTLDVKLPKDLFFMGEKFGLATQIGDSLNEYYIDTLTSVFPIWFVFPINYYFHRDLGSIKADIYCDPSIKIDNKQLNEMEEAISYYESCFGKLPFEKINVLFVGLPKGLGGGSLANFIFLPNGRDSLAFLEKVLLPEDEDKIISIIPHEIAHLWWGSSVAIFKDPWLAEGLACYWANKFEVLKNGYQPFDNVEYKIRRISYRLQGGEKTVLGTRFINSYYKTPYLLSMLELQMGFANFRKACRDFFNRYKNESAGFNELKEILIKHSNSPIDNFLTCWVDSNFSQNYSIDKVESKKDGSQFINYLRIKKTGKASSPVPISIAYKDGTKKGILLKPSKLYRKWKSSSKISSVFIDPYKMILESDRSDNLWPMKVRLNAFGLNIVKDLQLYFDFLSDSPGYNLYFVPDILYSERFGWELSMKLFGRRGFGYEEYFSDSVDKVQMGYNERNNDLSARLYMAKTFFQNQREKMMLNIFINDIHGARDYGFGIGFYHYFIKHMHYPGIKISLSLSHRSYYALEGVSEEIWPVWETTPVKIKLSFEHLIASLELENGLKILSNDKEYFRGSINIEKQYSYVNGRVFFGVTEGNAYQNMFDPAYEGRMISYPSFKYYCNRLVAMNLALSLPFKSSLHLRLFNNYINSLSDIESPIFESGWGISIGNNFAKFRIDMPVYLSSTSIDNRRWNWKRFRIQLYLLNLKIPPSPRLDFLVR